MCKEVFEAIPSHIMASDGTSIGKCYQIYNPRIIYLTLRCRYILWYCTRYNIIHLPTPHMRRPGRYPRPPLHARGANRRIKVRALSNITHIPSLGTKAPSTPLSPHQSVIDNRRPLPLDHAPLACLTLASGPHRNRNVGTSCSHPPCL